MKPYFWLKIKRKPLLTVSGHAISVCLEPEENNDNFRIVSVRAEIRTGCVTITSQTFLVRNPVDKSGAISEFQTSS
jgi:hypothetical protein